MKQDLERVLLELPEEQVHQALQVLLELQVPLVRGSLPRRPRPAAAAGPPLCTELRTVLTTAARWDAFLSLSSALGLRSASAGAASASSAIATGPRGVPRQCRADGRRWAAHCQHSASAKGETTDYI